MIYSLVIKMMVIFSLTGNLLAQTNFVDPNPQNTNKIFGDTHKKTTDQSQAIYDEGGQNAQYRMTESEKALDFVKKEIVMLKAEIVTLKREIEEIKTNSKSTKSLENNDHHKIKNDSGSKPKPF